MLQTKQKTPYTRVFKLSSGEEIIAKVVEEALGNYVITNPLTMVMGQKGFQFAPFMFMIDASKRMSISKSLVMADAEPTVELESYYESVTSGIALPQKSSIITQ